MFINLQICIIALVALKTNSFSQNQSLMLFGYYIKRCLSPAIINYDLLTKPLGNCPTTVGRYLDCLNNTKSDTIYFHPCPYLYFESGVIPVLCKNGSFSSFDYNSFCAQISIKEKKNRQLLMFHEAGVISNWQYQYEINSAFYKNLLYDLAYFLRIIDVIACFFGFVVLLLLIPLKDQHVMLHRNLIASVMLKNIAVIVYTRLNSITIDQLYQGSNMKGCSYAYLLSQHFVLVEIFWTFNEAIFHFRKFFIVFVTSSYMWVYFVVGWLVPAIFSFALFLPLKLHYSTDKEFTVCWNSGVDSRIHNAIFIPLYIILAINTLILMYLMWVVRKKIKNSRNRELEKLRKSVRSFFILALLLGGGYTFVSTGPNDCIPFQYLQVLLIAPQGIYICIFQIFVNKKVRKSARLLIIRLRKTTFIARFISQPNVNTSIEIVERNTAFTPKVWDSNDLSTLGTKNVGFEYELR
ncbi:corticotropin-releasing factor receptor 2-like [Hydra vulgaris]|uniref:Corticotropin-releasing factor receptor 2-like n=1 Tax=Hydra vulgaris TaxID=6087 RepID=A0ABM4CSU4_HYDVU